MNQPKIEILPLKKGFLRAAAAATHVLVRIVAPAKPTEVVETPRPPLDLALVIDRSGSMGGRPIEAAVESAARIVRGLREDDRVTVIAFDDHIEVVQTLAAVADREALAARIKSIDARGSTNLFGGWEEGVKQLAPFTRKERIARVILLSDGQANQGLLNESEIFAQVAKAAGAGEPVKQEIAVSVKGDKVSCTINGAEVGSWPKAEVLGAGKLASTDGFAGIRVGHNAEVVVTGFGISK